MNGKELWRTLRYLTFNGKYTPLDFDSDSGSEFWENYDNSKKEKYSYKWCLAWIKSHPGQNYWDDLIMKDPYLVECCKKRKVTMPDQLWHYVHEYWFGS